jgi:hypothetical protein
MSERLPSDDDDRRHASEFGNMPDVHITHRLIGQIAREFSQKMLELAEAQRAMVETQRVIVEHLSAVYKAKPEDQSEPVPLPRRFLIDAWNTYAGFRADMLARQREVAGSVRSVQKQTLANKVGGDTVKNISRVMTHYWLPLDLWPPSRWPEQQPSYPPLKRVRATRATLAIAGLAGTRVLLDVASDGKLDNVVRLCRLVTPVMHVAALHLH